MKTTTSIKLDPKLKKEASELAAELGVPLSTIVTATLKNFVRERRIVFSVEPEINEKTKKLYREIDRDIREGKNIMGPYRSVADLRKALLK